MKFVPKMTKADRNESVAEAKEWQRSLYRYEQAGLCPMCAAQAAFGHSIGFSHSHPPCPTCAPIVAAFPRKAFGVWRMMTRADHTAAKAKRAADEAKREAAA
jgi:hypothetical protein